MVYPDNLRYSSSHEWAEITGKTAKIGISDFAQHSLGDIVFIELPEIGREVKAGDAVCEIESVKAASSIYTPLSGKIAAVNNTLADAPELINQKPYESYIFTLELSNPGEADKLLDSKKYAELCEKEAGSH
ncbi:MAG: glycine cleavage system protein H [Spirochaetes bacterium GWF1_51_8]|nr:MAG: glycine cleavage system protein H [Spirochaetes bacterium GWF1_51_8]